MGPTLLDKNTHVNRQYIMDDLIRALNWRYATKSFDPQKKLSPEDVQELCEALRLSASSFGLQLWQFLLISNPELKKQLKAHSYNQSQVEDCSHLFVLCSPRTVKDEHIHRFLDSCAETRSVSRESLDGFGQVMKDFVAGKSPEDLWHWMDRQIYIALGNLLTCCALKNIDACPIEGFVQKDYDRILKLEEQDLRSVVVCPVGVRSGEDKYATKPKVRYPLDQVVTRLT